MTMKAILSGDAEEKAEPKSKDNQREEKAERQPKSKIKKIQVVDLGKKGSFDVHKGKLHRALGIDPKKPIPQAKLKAALKSSDPEVRRMARSAMGLEAMAHKK